MPLDLGVQLREVGVVAGELGIVRVVGRLLDRPHADPFRQGRAGRLGTVAFAGFRLSRGTHGGRRLLRTYTFDYTSDGFERAQGFIVLAGLKLEAVGLAGSPS